jgi:rhodanese-related sulfurtransferase
MTPPEVEVALKGGAVVLDLRQPRVFAAEHLPGAINLQFNRADLAERADRVLPRDVEYVVLAEPDVVAAVAVKLLREAGFKVVGHLESGLNAWKVDGRNVEQLHAIEVDELKSELDRYQVVDVRDGYEYRHGHIVDAILFPSGEAWQRLAELSSNRPLAVICASQNRSALVASMLQRAGREPVVVMGGMTGWLERGYPVAVK